jgi:hypothetical protein
MKPGNKPARTDVAAELAMPVSRIHREFIASCNTGNLSVIHLYR